MWRKAKWIALTCTAVILCVIGYYGYSFYQFGNNIQEKKDEPFFTQFVPQNTSQTEEAPPKWEGKERVNILLLGADSRGTSKNEVPRSDTIMVASVDPTTKKASLFSILRDTYVKIPGHGSDRINTAFAMGGPNLAMKTVGDLLGLPIQYYVYTDFQGFMALVDAIGGIEIEVEKDMKYRDSEEPEFDINLKKGLQQMDGKTALQYVRFRHDALSDYSRTERQRRFMTAVAQELQTTSSIFRLPTILNKIDPYITTNLSITDMIKLGSLGFEVKAQGVNGIQVPPSSLLEEDHIGGASVLTVNTTKLQKYVKEQLDGSIAADADANDEDGDDRSGAGSTVKAPVTEQGTGGSKSSNSGVTSGGTSGSKAAGTSTGSTGTKSAAGSNGTTGTTSGTKTNSGSAGASAGTKTGSSSSTGTSTGTKAESGTSAGTSTGTKAESGTSAGASTGTKSGSGSTGTSTGTKTESGTSAGTSTGTKTESGTSAGASTGTKTESGSTGTSTGTKTESGASAGTSSGTKANSGTTSGSSTGTKTEPGSTGTSSGTKSNSGTTSGASTGTKTDSGSTGNSGTTSGKTASTSSGSGSSSADSAGTALETAKQPENESASAASETRKSAVGSGSASGSTVTGAAIEAPLSE